MDYKKMKQKIDDWFDSEEGQKSINSYFDKIDKVDKIKASQLDRLNKYSNFDDFVQKIIIKYNSDIYKDRWYKRGIIPPEDLNWFLFEYAEKYGRNCTNEEWNEYGNEFTSDLFYHKGYYFNRMDGQGSAIQIIKHN